MKTKLEWIKENYDIETLNEEQMKDLVVEHWNDMIENGYNEKYQSNITAIARYENICFACIFYKGDCKKCPFSIFGDLNVPCANYITSPYYSWKTGIKKYNMMKICDLFM